jgi:probable rRNA maturation factor
MFNLSTSEPSILIRIPLKYRFRIKPDETKIILSFCRKFLSQKNIYDLSIIYTNNRQIHAINQKYRNMDEPTDVLSFPMDNIDPETGKRNLGDIFISVQKAEIQANEMKHSLKIELALLLIHGYLHLNGFDHETEQKKKIMWSLQERILSDVIASKQK